MEACDMIIQKGGNMSCNGYTVNSNFFNNEIPINYSINNEDLFGGKSLPAGLAFFNTESIPETIEDTQIKGLIDPSIYDKFIDKFSSNKENVENDIKDIEKDVKEDDAKDVEEDGAKDVENVENNEKVNINKKSRKISTIKQFKTRKQNRKLSKRNSKITFKQTRTKH